MNSILLKIDKIISRILSILVLILALGIILTVLFRYLFGISYSWFEEFLTVCFASVIFLGSAICIREKQHINISYFTDKLTTKNKKISQVFSMICIIVISLFMFVYSIKWIVAVGGTVSPASEIKMGVFYSIVPISSFLTIFYCVIDIISQFKYIVPAKTGYFEDSALPKEKK